MMMLIANVGMVGGDRFRCHDVFVHLNFFVFLLMK